MKKIIVALRPWAKEHVGTLLKVCVLILAFAFDLSQYFSELGKVRIVFSAIDSLVYYARQFDEWRAKKIAKQQADRNSEPLEDQSIGP